jgi:hypothetical protein
METAAQRTTSERTTQTLADALMIPLKMVEVNNPTHIDAPAG